eukprot:1160278-Pelagomonas_calceolata.AAC.1
MFRADPQKSDAGEEAKAGLPEYVECAVVDDSLWGEGMLRELSKRTALFFGEDVQGMFLEAFNQQVDDFRHEITSFDVKST